MLMICGFELSLIILSMCAFHGANNYVWTW